MKKDITTSQVISWILGIVVFTIGVLNVFLVHAVPGIIALLLAVLYFPATNAFLQKRFGFSIPLSVKTILAILIIWFTLGVSDLGDIIDDWLMN